MSSTSSSLSPTTPARSRPRQPHRALPRLWLHVLPRPLPRPTSTPVGFDFLGRARIRVPGQSRRHGLPIQQQIHLRDHTEGPKSLTLARLPRPAARPCCNRRSVDPDVRFSHTLSVIVAWASHWSGAEWAITFKECTPRERSWSPSFSPSASQAVTIRPRQAQQRVYAPGRVELSPLGSAGISALVRMYDARPRGT